MVYAGGSPVSDKAVNDVSVVNVNNEHSVELLSVILAQLGSDLHG